MNWMTFKMDNRIQRRLLLIDQPSTQTKEVYFQYDGKKLFLASIAKARLSMHKVNLLEEWLEEVVINLPPYEDLLKIVENEGERVQEQLRMMPCTD